MTLKIKMTDAAFAALKDFCLKFNLHWHGNDNPDVRADVMLENSFNQELFQAGFDAGKKDKLKELAINIKMTDEKTYQVTPDQLVTLLRTLQNEHKKAEELASDYLETLIKVLNVIGYTEEYASKYPGEKVSVTVERFLNEHFTKK